MFFRKKRYHIYVVDDVEQMTDFIEGLVVSNFDAKVSKFLSAPDALASLENEKRSPDLILCDQMMPEMTGLQMQNAVRSKNLKIPFIFVTGCEGDDVVEDQMVMLSKPINAKLLFAQMERMLDKHFVVA